jgi:hypothetical protein
MVILAYFFSLAKAVDNVWWMRGIAEREVFGIQSKLPEEWQWAMAWPLQKLAGFAAFTVQTRQAEVQRMVPSWRCQLVAAERSRADGSAILDT